MVGQSYEQIANEFGKEQARGRQKPGNEPKNNANTTHPVDWDAVVTGMRRNDAAGKGGAVGDTLEIAALPPTDDVYVKILRVLAEQTEPVQSIVVGESVFPGTGAKKISPRMSEAVSAGLVEHAGGHRNNRSYRITAAGLEESRNAVLGKDAIGRIVSRKKARVKAAAEADPVLDYLLGPASEILESDEFALVCAIQACAHLACIDNPGRRALAIRKASAYLNMAVEALEVSRDARRD